MPALRPILPFTIGKFDVLGFDSDAQSEFVRHVAMANAESIDHSPDAPLPLTHMRPPFTINDQSLGPFHTVGTLPLTDGERSSIQLFVTDYDNEQKAEMERNRRYSMDPEKKDKHSALMQYCIHPHKHNYIRKTGDNTVQLRQFSCVGFVLEAYSEAGINLINFQDGELPQVSLDLLCMAYPDLELHLRNKQTREKKNLNGDGPWPITMAGYVINALAQTDPSEINSRKNLPYKPVFGDEYFPSRKNAEQTT
jgi:hypothetical protein